MKRLIDIIPEGSFTGFLTAIGSSGPWSEVVSNDDLARLDQLYLYSHSGEKFAAPLMNMFLDSETGRMTNTTVANAAAMAFSLWANKWTRLWDVNASEYDPLENYNMTEDGTETPTGKEKFERSHTGHNTTESVGLAVDNEQTQTLYGMNSSTGVPAGKTNTASKNTITVTPGATDKEEKSFDQRVDTHHLTRTGNIGVTTSQQMAQAEIDLWQWNFWLQVFEDLDTTFCLDCY